MSYDPMDDDLYGPAFEHQPGSMRPPYRPGTFDHDMGRPLTPTDRQPLYDNDDPGGMNGHYRETLLSDGLIDQLGHERGLHIPPRNDDYELYGQPQGSNCSDEFRAVGTAEDDHYGGRRPSLLSEGLPGGMRPTASEIMPELRQRMSGLHPRFEGGWPGWNDSMPEGAVGYVQRGEAENWGHVRRGAPRMHPAEFVDEEFIQAREADPDWSPSECFDGPRWDERLMYGGPHYWGFDEQYLGF
ncbi:hypothetical protein LTR62_005770 [Meristemomyces frigidus]|uniref:Uncharacterized protein n=1 Tax=Meristemomyces frigidus TaxID=1508187 RepID=A0AAN7TF37_9PEZI|nr:hypothetical protein LTR62_005770 [Meristemomyces frigidus]